MSTFQKNKSPDQKPTKKKRQDEDDVASRGISAAQYMFRSNKMYPERLHRHNIAERLLFESGVVFGTARLINQVLVFALFLSALRIASDEGTKRGIFQNLGESFDFDALRNIPTRAHFVDKTLPMLSHKSKEFFPLSSQYFDAGTHGSKLILSAMTVFTQPRPGPEMELKSTEFSFTAWVRSIPQFAEGYILRKRPLSTNEELTCWGWYLHAEDGPSFVFAGHDHYPTVGDSSEQQIQARIPVKRPFDPNKEFLMTVVVTETEVTFFQDNLLAGSVPLLRPVTDCFNNGQGVWMGDSGLQIGIVRYFPFALTNSSLEELMVSGNLLSDLATGSGPSEQVDTDLEAIGRQIVEEVLEVKKGVNERHDAEKLTGILKQVDEKDVEDYLDPPPSKYPNAKVGNNPFDGVERTDSNDRKFHRLFHGPEILSVTSDKDARNMTAWPPFVGTGVTFTFWYRHVPCEVASCGMFLFEAIDLDRPQAEIKCWNFWIENNAIWYENANIDMYPKDFVEAKFNIDGGQTWRHLAITLNETSDEFVYYVDGKLAWTGPWRGADGSGRPVRESDCAGDGKFLTLGRSYPGYTYGLPVGLHDLRMYVHGEEGPVTAEEVEKISKEPTPELGVADKCALSSDATFFDTEWRDAFGHDCAWYGENAPQNPAICKSPLAAQHCPIACKTRQECFNAEAYDALFVYDRIRKIEVEGAGTICIGDDEDHEQVVEECRQYVLGGIDISTDSRAVQWVRAFEGSRTKKLDVTVCDDLDRAINDHCKFNGSVVKEWTRRVKESGGDYSIAFWMKPEGFGSLQDGRYFPTAKFYGSLSPPQHNLAVGVWENPNGEVQFSTNCGDGQFEMENVELKRASETGWTFVAVTRVNSTGTPEARVVTNLGSWREVFKYEQCLYNDAAFFRALEFNYPSLISPLMLSSRAIPMAKLQETYYAASGWMPEKAGPEMSAQESAESGGIPVTKRDYPEQSTLVAPPIIFQTMREPTDQCEHGYAERFINLTFARMQELKCRNPFDCDADPDLLRFPHKVISCPGDPMDERLFFGQQPEEFGGKQGYSDLLYSVVDNGFLWRGGDLIDTANFISSNSEDVKVILVFYTPKFGITSVMTLNVDFQHSSGAKSEVFLQHYEVVEGDTLRIYMFVQIIVLVSIAIMAFDIVVNVKYLVMSWMRKEEMDLSHAAGEAFKQAMDICIAAMVIVYIIIRIPTQLASADETDSVVGSLASIEWADVSISAEDKTSAFFNHVRDLLSLIRREEWLNSFCNVVLVLSLLRLIKCTSMHPRLALLEGTLLKAWDDLWHAALLIVLLMGVFAGIATWRFGSEREDFGTFERSMQTQFEMTFGEFPPNWHASRDLQVYTVFYFMIVFLLVQNFLLAVVVEAYMAVRRDNEELETEQEFIIDIYSSLHSHLTGFREGWPTPHRLGTEVKDWSAKNSIGFKELLSTGLFKSPESVGRFLKYYKHYEFLVPTTIGSHGAQKKDPEERRAQELELRLAKAMGVSVPSLKEEAALAFRKAELRREGRKDSADNITLDRFHGHNNNGHHDQNGALNTPVMGIPGVGGGHHMGVTDPQTIKRLESAGKNAESAHLAVEELRKDVTTKFQDTNMQVSLVKDRLRNMDVKMDYLIRILQDKTDSAGSAPQPSMPSLPPNGNPRAHAAPPTYGSQVYHGREQSFHGLDAADRDRPPEAPVVDQLASMTGGGGVGSGGVANAQLMFGGVGEDATQPAQNNLPDVI